MKIQTNVVATVVAVSCTFAFTGRCDEAKGPVKVFILSGQSNMQGKAAAFTLDAVINDPKTRDRFKHLKKDGEWVKREDVWVTFLDNKNRGGFPLYGTLTVGYGSEKSTRDENNKKIPVPGIGPELGIGYVLGDHYDEQVLLIKAAWGGRAVKYSFRPPSAIPSDDEIKAQVAEMAAKRQQKLKKYEADKAAGKKAKPVGPERTFEDHKAGYGSDYRKVLSETKKALDDIKTYFPSYDPDQGYEIAGFIWFQGWNDAIGAGNPDYVEQMAHFIRDMRTDLKVPDMPFVIGDGNQQMTADLAAIYAGILSRNWPLVSFGYSSEHGFGAVLEECFDDDGVPKQPLSEGFGLLVTPSIGRRQPLIFESEARSPVCF